MDLFSRYPRLATCQEDVKKAKEALISCFSQGGKLLLCGNGGSATVCEHMAGELMKGFLKKRPLSEDCVREMKKNCPALRGEVLRKLEGGLPAVAISSQTALTTAFANDVDAALAFAQGVMALGEKGDALLAISTSGNSQNVVLAAQVAKARGLAVIAMTGENGGALAEVSDVVISVPEKLTYLVQELHLPICHYLSQGVEAHFFGE